MTLAPNAGRDDPLACVPPFRGKLTDPRVGQTLDRLDVLTKLITIFTTKFTVFQFTG